MFRIVRGWIVVVALLTAVLGGAGGVKAQQVADAIGCNAIVKGVPKEVRASRLPGTNYIYPGAPYDLPEAVLSFTVPSGTGDTYVVTFSAECKFDGPSSAGWIEVAVQHTGALPSDPPPGPAAVKFCSANSYATHSAMFCERVGPGEHKVQILAVPVNGTGEIANWTLQLLVYE